MFKRFITNNFKTESFLLISAIITLMYHFLLHPISNDVQLIILFLLVLIVGVPHGALDFLVDEHNEIANNKSFSLKKFLVIYLTRLFAFALFWFVPWLAFSLFIVFSIFHFGETDMSNFVKPNKYDSILYFSYGFFILNVLLLSHLSEIENNLPFAINLLKQSGIFSFLTNHSFNIVAFSGAIFLSIFIWFKSKGYIGSVTVFQIVQFVLLIVILKLLPLTLAFTFYFALWHSVLSVRNIFLYFRKINTGKAFKIICGKSILFSSIALGSIMALYFIMKVYVPNFNLLFALLIILSVLTLPHLTIMHSMYKNNKALA